MAAVYTHGGGKGPAVPRGQVEWLVARLRPAPWGLRLVSGCEVPVLLSWVGAVCLQHLCLEMSLIENISARAELPGMILSGGGCGPEGQEDPLI